jgi:hypothetical protein
MFQNTQKNKKWRRREFTPKANLPPKYPDLNKIKPSGPNFWGKIHLVTYLTSIYYREELRLVGDRLNQKNRTACRLDGCAL